MNEKAAAIFAEVMYFLLVLLQLRDGEDQAADIAGRAVLGVRGDVSLQCSAVDEISFAKDAVFVDVIQMFLQPFVAAGREPTDLTENVMSGRGREVSLQRGIVDERTLARATIRHLHGVAGEDA